MGLAVGANAQHSHGGYADSLTAELVQNAQEYFCGWYNPEWGCSNVYGQCIYILS